MPTAARSGPWSPISSAPGMARRSTRSGSPVWGSATTWGGGGHPLVGALMPKLQLDDGSLLADHARGGQALLADFAGNDELAVLAKAYGTRLKLVRGSAEGSGLSGLLVRPDGFVAWASDAGDTDGLETTLTRWLGAPAGTATTRR
ncbi:hypothetical protein [Amycolatopsis sp. 3B14]|uniref:aromatic-ring hydroxylase C-terminal domain-containing protein n=1 Tax=Amycolatopsis sp. 3B14 TaxID=3243600 RepID=UPI003D99ADA6